MAADPDLELVERCRADDADAFRELLNRFAGAVYAPIARVTPDQSRAEQLAQEVFLRIHRDLPYFRGEAPLGTWIARTTAAVCPGAFAAPPDDAAGAQVPTGVTVTPVPAQFVVRALARIRRERWRSEQAFDILFNAGVGSVAIATVALVWYFVDASGLNAFGDGTWRVLLTQLSAAARTVAPSVPGYLAAAALIAAVLIAWWWAER